MSFRRGSNRRISATLIAATAVMIAALSVAGCEKERTWDDPGPEAQFREFLTLWFKNDRKNAFEMIDPEDRRELQKPLRELEERVEKTRILEKSEMLVAGRVDNPYDMKSIEVEPKLESKPSAGDRFRLTLTYQDGRTGSARMVWRDDRWYVDLPLEVDRREEAERDEFGRPTGSSPEEGVGDAGAETSQDAEAAESEQKRRD